MNRRRKKKTGRGGWDGKLCPVSGKRWYASEADAAMACRNKDREMKRPPTLNAYRCGVCDGWHMTHQPVGEFSGDPPESRRYKQRRTRPISNRVDPETAERLAELKRRLADE